MTEDTIAGIASGMGGGIGIIRISGPDSLRVIGSIYRNKNYVDKYITRNQNVDIESSNQNICEWNMDYFKNKKSHTIYYGFIVDSNQVVDEVMVMLMKGPNSYTREDVIEIDSHGGPFLIQKILEIVLKSGARLAEPGEFTKRAFLNGRIDLSQAEAVMKMISSQNDFALQSAVKQLEGSVSQYIDEIRQEILHNLGFIETALDDPEHISLDGFSEQLLEVTSDEVQRLNTLLTNFDDGRMKSEGINTVIVGKPNAGKSSLMNLLLDENRAIVTEIAGTTRDILEEKVKLGSVMLNLVDTAGIHETEDIVENIGVDKAVQYVKNADFVIYVVDSSKNLEEADEQIISLLHGKSGIILLNKSDLTPIIDEKAIQNKLDWHVISFSNETKDGLEQLEDYIVDCFLKGKITYNDQIYLTNLRQKETVESALKSLKQVICTIEDGMPEDFYTIDMMDAYKVLGLIDGDTASEDLVNKIFKDFCMGK